MTKDELNALSEHDYVTTRICVADLRALWKTLPLLSEKLTANATTTQPLPFSWDDAPEWANYAAQDEDGAWFFYAEPPTLGLSAWEPTAGPYQCCHIPIIEWQQSLTQHPTPTPTRHPTIAQEFPNFSEQGLDRVFPDWTPTHYRNDVCPSYEIPAGDTIVKLWVHDSDRANREEDSYDRYLIEVLKDEEQLWYFTDEDMTGLMAKLSWFLVTRGSDVTAVTQMNFIELARAVGLVATR